MTQFIDEGDIHSDEWINVRVIKDKAQNIGELRVAV